MRRGTTARFAREKLKWPRTWIKTYLAMRLKCHHYYIYFYEISFQVNMLDPRHVIFTAPSPSPNPPLSRANMRPNNGIPRPKRLRFA